MRTLPVIAGLAVAAACGSAPAWAGAWPQDVGRWLLVNQFTYTDSPASGYNSQGRPDGHGSLQQFEFSPYIEYGVTEDWTLGLQPRLQYANLSVPSGQKGGGSDTGLAEVNLFSRYTLYKWDFDVLAVQAMLGAPGSAGGGQPMVAMPWPEYEMRLLYGHAFDVTDGVSGFFDTEIAYRLEGGHNADQIHSDTTLGLRPYPDWLVMLQFNATYSLHNNTGTGGDYDQYRLQAAIGKQIADETWLVLGAFHDLGGHNVALGTGATLAIWSRF
jgi:hypothetical protein